MTWNNVLVAEDERSQQLIFSRFLESHGFNVQMVARGSEVIEAIGSRIPDFLVLDYQLRDSTALDLIPEIRKAAPRLPITIVTGHGSIELAVQAIKQGADQFLTKPVNFSVLKSILSCQLEEDPPAKHPQINRTQCLEADPFFGKGKLVQQLEKRVTRLLDYHRPVLLLGESGSGKGVLARWMHDHGPRKDQPFLEINCAGLNKNLLESELFGFEPGAFTGATRSKPGLFEVAHRGTIFLDEIGDLDFDVQPKLLKVIEDCYVRRLGGIRDRKVDVNIIAATNKNLGFEVKEGRFREDLFYRISTIPIKIPPLRQRLDDLQTLVHALLESIWRDLDRKPMGITESAMRMLMQHGWPGNVRELRNVLERAVLLADPPCLDVEDFEFPHIGEEHRNFTTELTLAQMERKNIEMVLQEEAGSVVRAAERLDVPRSSLYQRIKKEAIAIS